MMLTAITFIRNLVMLVTGNGTGDILCPPLETNSLRRLLAYTLD